MKVLVLTMKKRYDRFAPKDSPAYQAAELVFCDRDASEEDWLAAAGDAEALFVTPVTWVRESLMERMPNLKLIHSEGVGLTASTWRPPGNGVSTCATTPAVTPGLWRSRRSC